MDFFISDTHFGHIHNNNHHGDFPYLKRILSNGAYNVGCMINNYMPVTLDEII
ncbi:MAG: hypothetical protein FWF57_08030 [Defluviitaleaceae bacterium]|nr:hypothetical protein [Defluviitaleaceae bacterium]